ncbi:MAG: hypothetical protein KGZ86_08325 [Candidatus Latescibacteria bacterium]|nr:hypothetical protein [Candidatus Latescibacterota bacterium]
MRKYKYWLFLSVTGLFIFFAISCPKTAQLTKDLSAPAWQDGEKTYYDIIMNDEIIGGAHYTIFLDMNVDMPVYILHLVTTTEPPYDYFYDTSVVCFRRDDFTPVWAWRKVESDMGYSIVTTRYSESEAEIWKETIDGNESFEVRHDYPFYDNEMVLTLLRALRFQRARRYQLDVIVPMTLEKITNTVRRISKATVKTSVGSFECDKIQLRYHNRTYYIFYERNEPRRLIRYQEKNTKIALELSED